jgi:hypothetical protein
MMDLAVGNAPWIALFFAISAALAAQLAFIRATEAGPEKTWQDAALPWDRAREIDEHAKRYDLEIAGARLQTLATCLATGSALEAAAASQHGFVAVILVILGAALAAVGLLMNVLQSRRRSMYRKASMVNLQWNLDHKYLTAEEKETGFAREHPREAKAIKNAPASWW